MESRRPSHGHHGGRRQADHGGRKFRRGGGRGGGSFGSRQPTWYKGAGYTDHEVISIAEEVAGISGFLHPSQRGFSGAVKQRFSDFVVHELAPRSAEPVVLTSVAKKSKSVQLLFQERVLDFTIGAMPPKDSASTSGVAESGQSGPQVAAAVDDANANASAIHKTGLVPVVRELARKLQRVAAASCKLGLAAQEAYHLRQLVTLVTHEIGAKKGLEFEQFLEKVEAARAEFEAQRREAKQAGTTTSSAGAAAAAAAADGLTFYLGGLNDKSDRVFIHETMRRYGKSRIVADTLSIGSDTSIIRVRPTFAVRLLPGERDSRRDWPVGQPDYLQFTLYKRNKDTASVVNQLASMLKLSPGLFSYADVKDKRGITTQLCTVYRVPKERAQLVLRPSGSRRLDEQQYLVGDLRYVAHKLRLGDCAGNRVAMVVRSLADERELSVQDVQTAVQSWETHGFINFFGLQRFGNASTSFHLLGRAMLRKDFKLAGLLLLRPQDGEASKIRAAREHFRQHKDVAAALRMLPPYLVPERAVLEGLQQHGIEAHELAFRNIPKALRAAYVEAYQNFVWNEMASFRVGKLSATSALVGDLVLVQRPATSSTKEEDESGEPVRKRQKREKKKKYRPPAVMVLTESNVGDYTIEDVVLPVPGHAVKYPENAVGAAYEKILATDSIDLAAQLGPDGSHVYHLDGSYRHVVKKPRRVSFRLEHYEDPTKPLIQNDVDLMLAQEGSRSPSSKRVDSTLETSEEAAKEDKAEHRALVLEFDLDYGSDATVAVRELMKQSSSVHVNWQTPSSDAPAESNRSEAASAGSSAPGAAAASTQTKKPRRGDAKVITAKKKTQVAIGRPGFSLGRS